MKKDYLVSRLMLVSLVFIFGAVTALSYVVWKDSKKLVIDLPEEIEGVTYKDWMKLHYNKSRDTLFIEYCNKKQHTCYDTTHASCDGGTGVVGDKFEFGCICDGYACGND